MLALRCIYTWPGGLYQGTSSDVPDVTFSDQRGFSRNRQKPQG
jgi:hypothetical protein